jgi:hypothetical protein
MGNGDVQGGFPPVHPLNCLFFFDNTRIWKNRMNNKIESKLTIRGWIIRLVIIMLLAVAGAACASTTAVPLQLKGVMGCDVSKVTITGVHWFKDSHGAWRVVGVITNNSSQAGQQNSDWRGNLYQVW